MVSPFTLPNRAGRYQLKFLSTGKRKKKASRVFGQVVFEDNDSSLCYSTDASVTSSPLKLGTHAPEGSGQSPEPTLLFEKETSLTSHEKHVSFIVDDKENANSVLPKTPSTRKSSVDSFRNTELSRLRASYQSPQRKDLVQKTQTAINNATASVCQSLTNASGSTNPSLNAARKAKDDVLKTRAKKTKNVRFQWQEEKVAAKSFYNKVEENRRQIIAVQRKLASAHFKSKAKEDGEQKMSKYSKLEEEYTFNSDVYREHQQKLKEERDRNRKKSIETRAKLRQNHREGEERLKRIKEEEEAAIKEIRYDLHKSKNEVQRANAEARRKSFQFRAGDARRIRDIRSTWRDNEVQRQHESFELKRAAAKDVETYKRKMEEERRQSLQLRNQKGRERRQLEEQQKEDALAAEHESYLLKWAGEKDAEAYKKKMEDERRKSLAGRNQEAKRHRMVMQELESLAQEKEAESFMLRWAGENDAKEYLIKMAEERRKSLQHRGFESKRIREFEEEQHAQEVQKAIAGGLLKSDCQKDVENYKKECEERRRKSLQYRGKEKKLQALEAENLRMKKQQYEHEMFELESRARGDVEEYFKDCKRRRRKSLAFRAKEKRHHAKWKQEQREKELNDQHHTSQLRALDAQHMALSQQEERARMALDALRSAGCNIKGNPFGGLLHL
eukprot:scaffold5703_cov132-Cylindrotheca_fusiformis.AAC.4